MSFDKTVPLNTNNLQLDGSYGISYDQTLKFLNYQKCPKVNFAFVSSKESNLYWLEKFKKK